MCQAVHCTCCSSMHVAVVATPAFVNLWQSNVHIKLIECVSVIYTISILKQRIVNISHFYIYNDLLVVQCNIFFELTLDILVSNYM